jgi:hypothetical protein
MYTVEPTQRGQSQGGSRELESNTITRPDYKAGANKVALEMGDMGW